MVLTSSVIFSAGADSATESTGAATADRIIPATTTIPSMTLLQLGHGAFLITMIARGTDRSAVATYSTATERSNTTTRGTGNPFPAISPRPAGHSGNQGSGLVETSVVPEGERRGRAGEQGVGVQCRGPAPPLGEPPRHQRTRFADVVRAAGEEGPLVLVGTEVQHRRKHLAEPPPRREQRLVAPQRRAARLTRHHPARRQHAHAAAEEVRAVQAVVLGVRVGVLVLQVDDDDVVGVAAGLGRC